MPYIVAMLVAALFAFTCDAVAQDNFRFGIVTENGPVTMELVRKKVSVRALRTLKIGDPCDLLPGDLVLFVESDTDSDTVRRMGPSTLSFKMLKGVFNIGTSTTCPLNSVGKIPKGYRKLWVDAHDEANLQSQK